MRAFVLIPAALLAACGGEPSFDERYDGAEQEIRAKGEDLENDLAPVQPAPTSKRTRSADSSAAAEESGDELRPD